MAYRSGDRWIDRSMPFKCESNGIATVPIGRNIVIRQLLLYILSYFGLGFVFTISNLVLFFFLPSHDPAKWPLVICKKARNFPRPSIRSGRAEIFIMAKWPAIWRCRSAGQMHPGTAVLRLTSIHIHLAAFRCASWPIPASFR